MTRKTSSFSEFLRFDYETFQRKIGQCANVPKLKNRYGLTVLIYIVFLVLNPDLVNLSKAQINRKSCL